MPSVPPSRAGTPRPGWRRPSATRLTSRRSRARRGPWATSRSHPTRPPWSAERAMAPPDLIVRTLDSVKPFWNTDAEPIFAPEAIRALGRVENIETELLDVAGDDDQLLERRFAAVEALFQGG